MTPDEAAPYSDEEIAARRAAVEFSKSRRHPHARWLATLASSAAREADLTRARDEAVARADANFASYERVKALHSTAVNEREALRARLDAALDPVVRAKMLETPTIELHGDAATAHDATSRAEKAEAREADLQRRLDERGALLRDARPILDAAIRASASGEEAVRDAIKSSQNALGWLLGRANLPNDAKERILQAIKTNADALKASAALAAGGGGS